MRRRYKGPGLVFTGMVGISISSILILDAANSIIHFVYSPTQVNAGKVAKNRSFLLGGFVRKIIIRREGDGQTIHFQLTDNIQVVSVKYIGLHPELFREEQGIIMHGQLDNNGIFVAKKILTKHDEAYITPEVADVLEKAGLSKLNNVSVNEQNNHM